MLAKSQSSLALALSMMGQREEAEILFRSALSIEEAYADQNPSGAPCPACASLMPAISHLEQFDVGVIA